MSTDSTMGTNNGTDGRGSRRVVQGIVSGNGSDKTIAVRIERMFKHPKYKKYIRRHSKVHAHDETNEAHVGDRVELMECRPMSKTKRYRLTRVVERPSLPDGALRPTEVQAAATADAMGEAQGDNS
ncbi:MAG: 30S ribosomal protein S17 [Planctomycetota bacterium]